MCITMITALLILGMQNPPGPLDAFLANRASLAATAEFIYEASLVDSNRLPKEMDWSQFDVGSGPGEVIEGRWDCAGGVEGYRITKRERRSRGDTGGNAGERAGAKSKLFELLFDGEYQVYHEEGSPMVDVIATTQTTALVPGMGPFQWWDPVGFPLILDQGHQLDPEERTETVIDGRPVVIDHYRPERKSEGERSWIDVAYDPSVGYLPRFARVVFTVNAGKTGWVKEYRLVEVQECGSGGFVPTEWFEAFFRVEDFDRQPARVDLSTPLVASNAQTRVGHFRTTRLSGRDQPPTLDGMGTALGVLTTPGGFLTLPQANSGQLSAADIRRIAGDKLTRPLNLVFPTLDHAELHEYDRRQDRPWWPYAAILGLVIFGAILLVRMRHRRRLLLVALWCAACIGCRADPPALKLTARFREPRLLVESDVLSLTLMIKNEGNRSLAISKVDGGCSCREVQQADLPLRLEPGREASLGVKVSNRRQYEPQKLSFKFSTDLGELVAAAPLEALPRNSLNPEAPVSGPLSEGDYWQFDMVHRELWKSGERDPTTRLVIPTEFTATQIATQSGRVAWAPDVNYRDVTYRVNLVDRSLGLKKRSFVLSDDAGRSLAEGYVTWRRVAFLSSMPERVILGPRPVRVFLRCPDAICRPRTRYLFRSGSDVASDQVRYVSCHRLLARHDEQRWGRLDLQCAGTWN